MPLKMLEKETPREITTGELEPVLSKLVGEEKKEQKFRSLKDLRLKAVLKEVEEDTAFANALLVMTGCFFLLITFPLYPLWLIPFILLLVGFVAYYHAPLGTIIGTFVAFPAVAYQSPLFAWFFTLVISVTLITSFTYWHVISLLFITVFAPFNSLMGFFVPPLIAFSSLYLGSKRGAIVTLITVLMILILSVSWG